MINYITPRSKLFFRYRHTPDLCTRLFDRKWYVDESDRNFLLTLYAIVVITTSALLTIITINDNDVLHVTSLVLGVVFILFNCCSDYIVDTLHKKTLSSEEEYDAQEMAYRNNIFWSFFSYLFFIFYILFLSSEDFGAAVGCNMISSYIILARLINYVYYRNIEVFFIKCFYILFNLLIIADCITAQLILTNVY